MSNPLVDPLFDLPHAIFPSAWTGHIPFLNVLIKLKAPRTFVELGVHNGTSLIAAATALRRIPGARIFGVDTWQGDKHAGFYDADATYAQVSRVVSDHFPAAALLRMTFDAALERFPAGTVDILHIDGLHTYEAVKHDFESWLPKLAPSGVVLFHDISVHAGDFGVWQLWEELRQRYTTLEFHHSAGLGVLFPGPIDPALQPLLDLAADAEKMQLYREVTEGLATTLEDRVAYRSMAAQWPDLQQRAAADRQLAAIATARMAAIENSRTWRLGQWLGRLAGRNRRA
jgi:predicted O-methyltransferase YrrM